MHLAATPAAHVAGHAVPVVPVRLYVTSRPPIAASTQLRARSRAPFRGINVATAAFVRHTAAVDIRSVQLDTMAAWVVAVESIWLRCAVQQISHLCVRLRFNCLGVVKSRGTDVDAG